jgi:hypothetical protein
MVIPATGGGVGLLLPNAGSGALAIATTAAPEIIAFLKNSRRFTVFLLLISRLHRPLGAGE